MKNNLLVMTLLIIFSSSSADMISLGTHDDWSPYHSLENGKIKGLSIDALDCIFSKLKINYKSTIYPWSRAQFLTEMGKIDGFFSASRNNKRDKYATLSHLFLPQVRNFYIYKKGSNLSKGIINLDYIKKQTVSARFGTNMLYFLRQNHYRVINPSSDSKNIMTLLKENRLFAYLENELVFNTFVEKSSEFKISDFYIVRLMRNDMGVYFGNKFLDKNPLFLKNFNKFAKKCSLLIK